MEVRSVNVRVDLSAIRHNFRRVRQLLGPSIGITPVVKAEAYGHGLIPTARLLEEERSDMLGVAYLDEGLLLRKAGIRSPILLMCGIRGKEEVREALRHELVPVLFDVEAMRELSEEAGLIGRGASFMLKIDTGMGRLGIPWASCSPVLEEAASIRNIKLVGLISHLSSADDPGDDFTVVQISRFREVLALSRTKGLNPALSSMANSAALVRYPECRLSMVRPGLILYGYCFDPVLQEELRPAMRVAGKILQIKAIEAGSPVSYGRTFYAKAPSMIAVASGGYGEGLLRSMSNRAFALVGGRRVPVIGTVCMDMTILDVTGLDRCPAPGDEVVYVGSQGNEKIRADELAAWSGSISYEVLCSVGQRHDKEYVDEKEDNLGSF